MDNITNIENSELLHQLYIKYISHAYPANSRPNSRIIAA